MPGESIVKSLLSGRVVLAYVIAVVLAVVAGSLVQSHYNLQALASLGVEVGDVRASTMLRDIFSGFSPTYGGYVVAPALLVAFLVAGWIASRLARWRTALFVLGGYLGVLAAIPLVNWLSPVALLVGASRDVDATFLMAAGGAIAGLAFALLTARPHAGDAPPSRIPATAPAR